MQDSIKYLYQKRLNENEAMNIFGNILESIPGAAKKALEIKREERTASYD